MMTNRLTTWISYLLTAVMLLTVLFATTTVVAQSAPLINYQGKLTDASGAAVPNGTYNMRFWLLQNTSQATTSAVWTESLTGTNKVQVTNGLFSVMLGSTSALTAIDFNQELYLGVEIGGTGGSPTWDGEMSPRKPLGTVPAAFEAYKVGGVASSSFLRSDTPDSMSANSASTLLSITQNGSGNLLDLINSSSNTIFTVRNNGSVGIGTTTPGRELVVDGDFELTGGLYDNNGSSGSAGQLLQSTNGGLQWVSTTTLGIDTTADDLTNNSIEDLQDVAAITENYGDLFYWNGSAWADIATSSLGLGNGTFLGLSDTPSAYTANRIMYTNSGATALTDSADFVFTGTNLGIGDSTPTAALTVGSGDLFQVSSAGIVTAPGLTGYGVSIPTDAIYSVPNSGAGNYLAYSPVPKFLWHDMLAFKDGNGWGTPTFEVYNGSTWNAGTLDSGLFSQKEDRSSQQIDGTTNMAARWTWNGGNVSYSLVEWFMVGVTWGSNGSSKDFLIESSTDGITWTTRHTSTGNTAAGMPILLKMTHNGGDTYVRLTITVTNAKPLQLSSIRALSSRWGDQGGGSEFSYPYKWDDSKNIAFGSSTAVANGIVTIGSNTTAASGGLFFGTDTSLYRGADNTLRTDDSLVVSGNVGIGTANPTYNLDVYGGNDALRIQQASGTRTMIINGGGMSFNTTGTFGSNTWGGIASLETYGASAAPARVGYLFKHLSASPTGDAYQYRNSANTVLFSVKADGGGYFGGAVGIGTTSPSQKLSVAGDTYISGNISAASSTFTHATTTNLAVNGILRDGAGAAGANGQVLQTTGTGIQWVSTTTLGIDTTADDLTNNSIEDLQDVAAITENYGDLFYWNGSAWADIATSSLGLGNGTFLGLSDTPSAYTANRIMYTNSGATALTDSADFVFTGTNLGIGTTTPSARLDIVGDVTTATLGAEQITALADRDFSAAGNWSGTNWSVGSGVATHTAGANAFTLAAAGLDPDPVAGGIYQITFTTNTTVAGTITPSIGGGDGVAVGQTTGSNTQTQVITAADTSALTFTPDAAWTGTLDNISVRRITPSNATQIVRNSDNTIGLEFRAGGSGLLNSFIGVDAGKANTTGLHNAFIGYQAGLSNTTGFDNSFLGASAGSSNTTGSENTFLGTWAGYYNTTGSDNSFIGYSAGQSNTTGDSNAFLGTYAGYSNTTGSNNSFIGPFAGGTNTTGSYNLYLGYDTEGSATTNSSIGLGYNTTVTANNQLVIGSADVNGSITDAYFGQGVTKASPAGITINATGGSGTNNAGAALTFAGGKGTGNAVGGSINFQTANALGSGATLQSLTTKMTLLASGNLGIGTTTPSAKLHITGTAGPSDIFAISSSTNARLLTVTAAGNVGIAYSTPSARLDIAGNVTTASEGAEQITAAANRDFSAAGNWSGTNWTVGSGVATHTAGANAFTLAAAGLDPDPVAGGIYKITFTTNTTVAGTITPSIGGGDGVAVGQKTGSNTQTQVITAANTSALTFTPDAAWTGTLDNISVRRITPSNATQIVRNSDNTIGLEFRAGGTGLFNSFIGVDAGKANTTGNSNAFIGYQAGYSNTTGSVNSFIGYQAGYSNTTGSVNSFIGYQAGNSNTTGSNNSFIGYQAGYSNTTGYYNSFIGTGAGSSNTTGYDNSFIGAYAGNSNTTGSENTFLGTWAGTNNTTGSDNSFLGTWAGTNNTTGSNNSFLGTGAGYYNTTGSDNSFIGTGAGFSNITGYENTANGAFALESNTTGSYNVADGSYALGSNTIGGSNTALGYSAGAYYGSGTSTNQTSSSSVYLGFDTRAGANGNINEIVIGHTAIGSGSNSVTLGSTTITKTILQGNIGIGTTSPSRLLTIQGGDAWIGGNLTATGTAIFANLLVTGSSTIGGGTGATGLTINGTATTTNLKVTSLTASRGIFTGADNLLTTTGVSQYLIDSLTDETGTGSLVFSTNPLLQGFRSNASSTIGDGTATGGLTILGNSTTTGNAYVAGNLGIGTTPSARLDIVGDVTDASEGAEQITALADRDFSAAGNWSGTNWTVGSGVATHTAGANAFTLAAAGLDPDPVAGGIYQIVFTTNTTVAGTLTPSIGGVDGIAVGQSTGVNTQTQVITAADTSALTFTPDATWTGTLDNISVKRITPSNATQIVRNSDNTIGLEFRAGGSGLLNSFIGVDAGKANTTGSDNFFLGYQAGYSNTTGSLNSFLGSYAGYSNTTGFTNTFLGGVAGQSNTTGSDNAFLGTFAGSSNTTGSYNSFIGPQAGSSNTTGSYNLYLGYSTYGSANTSSSIGLGYNTTVTANNQLVIGSADANGSITDAYFGQGVTKASPAGITINATGGSGTNNAGAALTFAGGKGTGNAVGGSINFQTANALGSGSTLQSLTTKMTLLASGNLGIGTTTPNATLSVQKLAFSSAGVAGLDQYFQTTNSADGAVQYGDSFYLDAANTATTTIVGAVFRLKDATTYGNTVRGLEVQVNKGGNTQGENTALSGFARTFGVRGVTSGDAGGVYEPAGGYFETQGTTQGNAMRGYSDTITTANLLALFQASSTFSGTGLEMNFGNGTGSFSSTTSKFLDFQNAGTSVFTVSAYGTTTIGDGTTNNMASLQVGYGGICVDNDGSCTATSTGWVVADGFATGNSDLAEMYFSSTDLEPGEIVVMSGELSVDRATTDSTLPILGVVSTNPGLTIGSDDSSLTENEVAYPIALSGRVPVKLSTENGPIVAGDELMLSSLPGIAMKATGVGTVIGRALEDFDDTRYYSDTYLNQFGDSMVEPDYEPIFTNFDPRINDGCYYGGGSAVGEEPCVPLTATSSEGQVEEANAHAEADSIEEQLDELREKSTLAKTLADGTKVKVGQIVIFVEKSHRWFDDSQMASLSMLMSTSSVETVGQNAEETIFDRLVALANRFVDGALSVLTLKADRVETSELCVDGVCVGADDLRQLLNTAGQGSGETTSAPTPTPTPESSPVPVSNPEPEPVSESEESAAEAVVSEGEDVTGEVITETEVVEGTSEDIVELEPALEPVEEVVEPEPAPVLTPTENGT